MTMEVYGDDITSTAAYSRQQAFDSNLREIKKKRAMRRQLEAEEACGGSKQNILPANFFMKTII